jgi:hypothetical protein
LVRLHTQYCWTYANEWSEKLPELSAAGVVGPVFISVGDQEKLNKFLELNPKVPRSLAFVDDSATFEAYAVTGFGNIGKGSSGREADLTASCSLSTVLAHLLTRSFTLTTLY